MKPVTTECSACASPLLAAAIGLAAVGCPARHLRRRRIGLVVLRADGRGVRVRPAPADQCTGRCRCRGPTRPERSRPAGSFRLKTTPAAFAPVCAPGFSVLLAPFVAIGGRDALFWLTPLAGALLVWLTFLAGRALAARSQERWPLC